MKGIKNFILGFSLSLLSMSITGQLYSSTAANDTRPLPKNFKIDLFKTKPDMPLRADTDIFTVVKKETLSPATQPRAQSDIAFIPLKDPSLTKVSEISPDNMSIAYSPQDAEGIEDDEILSVNVDGNIPIDFSDTSNTANAEILYNEDSDKVAMLPSSTDGNGDEFGSDNAWLVAKGSKNAKNKKILEKYSELPKENLLGSGFKEALNDDKEISYKVAEKIKQSIIFPIPDEILNDENLTPTFIKGSKKTNLPKAAPKTAAPVAKKEAVKPSADDFKILPKVKAEEMPNQETSKSLLTSISSWFSDKSPTEQPAKNKAKQAPAYSSQGKVQTASHPDTNEDLVSFYETLQETKEEHVRNSIVPTELKLSFQPERAEISGQTLRWLKAFSEAAKDGKTYLQVRLDATAPIELQRKRLNLLYTIFINNGVDFKKVDTVFSLTEPNAFIIRTLKLK